MDIENQNHCISFGSDEIRQKIYRIKNEASQPFFFILLYQTTFSVIETGFNKLINKLKNAIQSEEHVTAHKDFVNYMSFAILSDQESIRYFWFRHKLL